MRRVAAAGWLYLTTSAPKPANANPQYSACSSASSMTRRPVSAPELGVMWLVDRTLVLCFHDDPPICARQWTVYSCVGM